MFSASCPPFLRFSTCSAAEDSNRCLRPTCELAARRSWSCSGLSGTRPFVLRRASASYLERAARVGWSPRRLGPAVQYTGKSRLRFSAEQRDRHLRRFRRDLGRCLHISPGLRSQDHLQGRVFGLVRADCVRSHSQHRDVHHFCVRKVARSGTAGGGSTGRGARLLQPSAVCPKPSGARTASGAWRVGPGRPGRSSRSGRPVGASARTGSPRGSCIRFPGGGRSSDPRQQRGHLLQLVRQRESR